MNLVSLTYFTGLKTLASTLADYTLQDICHICDCSRNLRQICEARGFENSDLGPDEHEIKLSDFEIESSHLRELDKVNKELVHVKNELDAMKIKVSFLLNKII